MDGQRKTGVTEAPVQADSPTTLPLRIHWSRVGQDEQGGGREHGGGATHRSAGHLP